MENPTKMNELGYPFLGHHHIMGYRVFFPAHDEMGVAELCRVNGKVLGFWEIYL